MRRFNELTLHSRKIRIAILLFHLLVLILYRIYGYSGHFGFDDMEYAKVAHQLIEGNYDSTNHVFYRSAIIIPTAITYSLLGVNDIASSIPPMIACALILLLIYRLMRFKSSTALSFALSITLFSEWILFYSNKLMVDIYVCLAVFFAVYVIYKGRFRNGKSIKYAALLAISLLYGFMGKGTIILIVPLLVFFCLYDLFRKKNFSFWIQSALLSILAFAGYFLIIYFLTGSFSARFDAIASNGYLNRCSYGAQPATVVIKRITQDFFIMTRNEGFAFSMVFMLSTLLLFKPSRYLNLNTQQGFFLSSSIILLLSSNFMSISLEAYNPMCLDFRHYLWLVPISAIGVSELIPSNRTPYRFQIISIISFAVLSISTYVVNGKLFWGLYFPMLILYVLFTFVKHHIFRKYIFPILFTGILLIQPVRISLNAHQNDYLSQVEFIQQNIIETNESPVVLTDKVQVRIGNYLTGFNSNKAHFINFDSIHKVSPDDTKRILINKYTQFFAASSKEDYPFYAQEALEKTPTVSNERLGIYIYDLNAIIQPKKDGELLLSSVNDFERSYKNWHTSLNQIYDSISNSGSHANKVGEYSGTFEVLIDTLHFKQNLHKIYIESSVFTLFEKETMASIVISIENSGETFLWKNFPVNKFQVVYNNWWKANAFVSFDRAILKPGSILKVFLWNPKKEPSFIDDFEVYVYTY